MLVVTMKQVIGEPSTFESSQHSLDPSDMVQQLWWTRVYKLKICHQNLMVEPTCGQSVTRWLLAPRYAETA